MGVYLVINPVFCCLLFLVYLEVTSDLVLPQRSVFIVVERLGSTKGIFPLWLDVMIHT